MDTNEKQPSQMFVDILEKLTEVAKTAKGLDILLELKDRNTDDQTVIAGLTFFLLTNRKKTKRWYEAERTLTELRFKHNINKIRD